MNVHKVFITLCLIALNFLLTSANQHLQTSADPKSGLLRFKVLEDEISIRLNAPGTKYTKYPNGRIKHLSFQIVTTFYEVDFYPELRAGKEQVSKIQRFNIFDNQKLLHGRTQSFDPYGNLTTAANWNKGRLHGKQFVYDEDGNIIEEAEYLWGFPINTWTTYYPNGKKATEIQFPPSDVEWNKSSIEGESNKPESLFTMDYPHPFPVSEKWYFSTGELQREKEYKAYKNKDLFVMIDSGVSTSYNKRGLKTLVQDTPRGEGIVTETQRGLGVTYTAITQWISNEKFKIMRSTNPAHHSWDRESKASIP